MQKLFATPAPHYANRRDFLRRSGNGFGLMALASRLGDDVLRSTSNPAFANTPSVNPLAPRPAHFPAKAQNVIWLFMNGGPSQVDTWQYKPELEKWDGKELPGFDKNTGFFVEQVGPVMRSPFKFAQYGESGAWVSEVFPGMAQHVDEMAFIHS